MSFVASCPFTKREVYLVADRAADALNQYCETHGEQAFIDLFGKLDGMDLNIDTAEYNRRAAEYHGITVEMLINSPNLRYLLHSYHGHIYERIRRQVQGKLDLTDAESWAVMILVTEGAKEG